MVTIINNVKSKRDDIGLISVRWRDEQGNRKEDIFRHFPYVYVNPEEVYQLQSSRDQARGTVRKTFPLTQAKYGQQLRKWRQNRSRHDAHWENGLQMYGVVSSDDEDEQYNLDGKRLHRVDFRTSAARNAFRRAYTPLYASRSKHEEQFCIRPNIPENQFKSMFNSEMPTHVAYIDLETLQYTGKDGDVPPFYDPNNERNSVPIGPNQAGLQEMSMIAVYADWLDQYVVWTQHPNFAEYDTADLPKEYEGRGETRFFNNERDLLENFVEWVETYDPDMFVAWNGDGYDFPMLHYRLEVTGVGPQRMSPIVHSTNNQFTSSRDYMAPSNEWTEDGDFILRGHYRASRQPIRGRTTMDLMPAFAKWWRSTKGQDIGFRVSLNRATNDLLADYIDIGKAEDFKPNFFDKTYDTFLEDFIYYNLRDVHAMVAVEEYCNVIELHLAIQNFLHVPFGSTFNSTRFCGVMFNRDAGFLPKDPVWDNQQHATLKGHPTVLLDELSYEGAEVVDVETEGNMGLHHNVAALDAKAMYPYNIIGKNICWLTAYMPEEGDDNSVTFDLRDKEKREKFKEVDYVVTEETVAFNPNMEGSLPRIVKVVLDQRSFYKGKMKEAREAGDDLAYKQADNMQKAVKVVANSFYGVLGNAWEWGRDSIPFATFALAGATTKYGKKQIHTVRDYCASMGLQTIFGHTDSVFVKLGDYLTIDECVERGGRLADEISTFVQETLKHSGAEWEYEQFMDRFFIAKKNRYAGRIAWADGELLGDRPLRRRLKVSGFELKAANTARAVGDVQMEVLERMYNGETLQQILSYLHGRYESVASGEIPIADLAARKTMRQHLPHAYRRVGYGRWGPCNCGACPIMKHRGLSKEQKASIDKNRKDDVCYAIAGPKNSNYRRYTVGEPLWRLLAQMPAAAAWFNDFIASDTEATVTKGESFYIVAVKAGPYATPYMRHKELKRDYGFIGVRSIEQASDFTPDFEVYAHDAVVAPLKNIFEGMQWSLELIKGGKVPTLSDFLV